MKYTPVYSVVFIAVIVLSAAVVDAVGQPPFRDDQDGCTLYVLRSIDGEIVVDAVAIPTGRTVVLGADDIITFILPLSPGQSGDLIQRGRPKGEVVARCEVDELHLTVRFEDGRERRLPPVEISGLAKYDVRVNVVGGDGTKRAFMIRAYGDVGPAGGPVVNMFGSAIPLEDGDYSITTEVTEHRPPQSVEGSVALEIVDGFLLAEGTLPDGAKGSFIVDFGASGTVVARSFVPEGTPVHRVKAIEYSEGDGHELDGVMGGAGGLVEGFNGSASLVGFELGPVSFGDVTVNVIREMPSFIDAGVVGIIGLDLLHRADVVDLEFIDDDAAVLTFSIVMVWFSVGLLHYFFTPGGLGGALLQNLSSIDHINEFARGVIDSRRLILYLGGIVFLLMATTKSLEAGKWR